MSSKFYKIGKCKDVYKLDKLLGKGSHGSVFRGKLKSGEGGYIAVKFFNIGRNPSDTEISKQMFDGLLGAYLHSKGCDVTNVFDAYKCTDSGKNSFLIAMDYIAGKDLKRYIKETSPTQVVKYELTRKILEAFSCLHNYNVFHRDIKLDNIMMVDDDRSIKIKIIDFGLSCASHASGFEKFSIEKVGGPMAVLVNSYSCRHGPVGALLYQPPEELLDELNSVEMKRKDNLETKDSYALGCALYEIWQNDGRRMLPGVDGISALKEYSIDLIDEIKLPLEISPNEAPPNIIKIVKCLMCPYWESRMTIKQALMELDKSWYQGLGYILGPIKKEIFIDGDGDGGDEDVDIFIPSYSKIELADLDGSFADNIESEDLYYSN